MKTMLMIEAVLAFLWGFSGVSQGKIFTPVVKALISLVTIVFTVVCAVKAILRKEWLMLVLTLVLLFVCFAVGSKLVHLLLQKVGRR